MTAKMDNRLKVKFEQGILLAIPALDLTTLLTLTRTARAFYLAATPYAYRQIALRGVVHYRDLLYILNAEEPSREFSLYLEEVALMDCGKDRLTHLYVRSLKIGEVAPSFILKD